MFTWSCMKLMQYLIGFLAIVSLLGQTVRHGYSQLTTFTLDNGIRVTINVIPDTGYVGIETLYDVGFIDEPAGMVQSAHLLEHLVCVSPIAGFERGQALEWLNRHGMSNAETLPDFTHYDYAVSQEHLEKVLEMEAARLRGIIFDHTTIEYEAKRCYQETDFVEANPATGMFKHALMALSHAWRFQADKALVRGGLEELKVADLQAFHRRFYVPGRMMIALTGDVEVATARELLNKTVGAVPMIEIESDSEIDWSRVPEWHTIRWDARTNGVGIAWPAPRDRENRIAVSLLGMLAMGELMNDTDLKAHAHAVLCSNNLWPVGRVPIFVYASLRDDSDAREMSQLLTDKFRTSMTTDFDRKWKQVQMMLEHWSKNNLTPERLKQTLPVLIKMGRNVEQATQMVLLQDALNQLTSQHLFGPDQEIIDRLRKLSSEEVLSRVNQHLQADMARTVHIVGN